MGFWRWLMLIVMYVVLYLYLIPLAIIFLWNNLVVVHNPLISPMDHIVAIGIFMIIAMLTRMQLINIRYK